MKKTKKQLQDECIARLTLAFNQPSKAQKAKFRREIKKIRIKMVEQTGRHLEFMAQMESMCRLYEQMINPLKFIP